MANPPTTTLQRLKGLTTGSLPTFIDAGSNFNGDVIDEDNLISQLYYSGRRVAFAGDDTWDALFGPYLYRNLTFPYESLNVWDLHSVDQGVIDHIFPMIRHNSTDWDVLIGHFLGVDHCGHRYGPQHYAMKEKLLQLDTVIRQVISQMDNETVLFVFGDHGMDSTGNHGGETRDELESALFMYSKTPYFGHVDSTEYDTGDLGSRYRSVNQIDFVPTSSMLLGIPIPFNSLGSIIKETFLGPQGNDTANLAEAMRITASQIDHYRHASQELAFDSSVNELYQHLNASWLQNASSEEFVEEAYNYQQFSLAKCKEKWATFDDTNIAIGIGLMSLAWILLVIYSKLIPSVVVAQLNPQFFYSSMALMLVYTALLASFIFVFKPTSLPISWALLLGVALGIVNGILAPIMDRYSIPWLVSQVKENLIQNGWTYMGIIIIAMHSLIFTSNSFIIWEDQITCFWLVTFGVCAFFKSFQLTNSNRRLLGAYHSLIFISLTRLVSQIKLCREEQGDKCISNFQTSFYAVAGLYISAIVLPWIIKSFYISSNSYESSAPVWISQGFRAMMFLTALTWSIELLEHDLKLTKSLNISFDTLKTIRITLARIVLGVSLLAANFGWASGPLCVKVELQEEPKRAHIIGYGNAYGSTYFLFFINFLSAILLCSKPLAGLSLAVLTYQFLSLLEIVDLLNIRTNLISVVVVGLLGYLHFFTTGHQATLQSIHWDAAFIITETISFPFTHLTIILDTFGSFILISIGVALLTLWRQPPTSRPVALVSKVVENATSLLLYQISLTISTMVMTNHFRRHLMVWKIFAPRYMMNGLILIVMNFILVFVTIGFASPRVLKRWYDVFGA
ncbi:hypothetical protein FOA43_001909 [Brettanomyces nanus]|uniref:GPI ethanolamine phosphate transferase 3 n=1 Tax=Eeniella nana TaxID=13502 RepID=A0A875S0T6_EENNA|nr:uncharacterized protein FOA43_001909 [Brettanomyces nanus]QPG74578.1 hypothetical protein FOA43_001909 [Brettanomyces nanus]